MLSAGVDLAAEPKGTALAVIEWSTNHARLVDLQLGVTDGGMDWRRRLAFRDTDRFVRERTKRWPLSVSTDRLGLTAMRCAGLLARIHASGVPVDRAGFGTVVEVYPAATLRLWGFDTAGYRASPAAREMLLSLVQNEALWFDFAGLAPLKISSCDAFDAVVAAMAARNAALGKYEVPSAAQMERARSEGWIALPTGPLSDLMDTGAQ